MLVDDADYTYITELYDLKIDTNGYVQCSPKKKYKKMGLYSLSLHKLLIHPEKTGRFLVIDHRDRNKLNNQKDNLRLCTQADNMKNRKTHKKTVKEASKYKGVVWLKDLKKWRAHIQPNVGNRISIGCFTDEIAAANAYNYYAMIYHGEFANLNDVPFMSKDEWEKDSTKTKGSSRYRGVSFVDNKWLVQIYHKGRNYRVGSFISELDAAKAYNQKAIELKGDKAILNEL